jgi:V/A-type H+-transporting ATPase subunit K
MQTFLTAALIIVPALVLMFSAYYTFKKRMEGKSVRKVMRTNVMTFLILIVLVSICAFAVSAANETAAAPAETAEVVATAEEAPAADSGNSKGLGLLAAALVTAISGIGGGIAVAAGAPAAIAATSEDPKSFGKSLIFVALGESIALYGVVISILILNKV